MRFDSSIHLGAPLLSLQTLQDRPDFRQEVKVEDKDGKSDFIKNEYFNFFLMDKFWSRLEHFSG